jgi:membrane protease YdiL (CAAX protease family)
MLLSWVGWLPLVGARLGWWEGVSPYWHLVGSLGPALAALLVTAASGGTALRSLLAGMTLWATPSRAWMAAVGGPLLLLLTGGAYVGLTGGALPAWAEVSRVPEYPALGFLAILAAEVVFYGFGEEVGWRGFALPRMMRRWGALRASLLLSLPWALWHLPLLLTNETYSSMNPGLLLGWYLSLLTGSVIVTWLYRLSKGSILVLAVFHGLLDVAMVNAAITQEAMTVQGALVTLWGLWAAWRLWREGRVIAAGVAA